MNNQVVTVNLVPGLSAPAVVRVSQYDYGRPIVFNILDGTKAAIIGSSATITVVGTKPSGLGFSETALTISGGAVTLNTTLAMTQESGLIPAEIRIEKQGSGNVGTANFILAVEPSPHPDGTTDGTQETMADLETRLQGQIDALDSRIDAIEGDQSIIDDIDALDARVTALEQGGSGLSQTEKNLILTLFSKAAYAEDDAGVVYDALEALWTTTTRTITYNLSHVSSSNTTASVESGQSYTTTLTASTNYTLNSVTVTMGGVDITSTAYSSGTVSIPSVTGNIVITATAVLAAESITATYTQSGTVYDTDSLDSLKADLVVTVNYAGGTSETVPASAYTLSGTLTVGTSTVTVSYAGLTTTISVTVSEQRFIPSQYTWLYDPRNNVLFSESGYATKATGGTGGTETLSNGELVLNTNYSSSSQSNFTRFNFNDTTTTNGILSCRALINECFVTSSSDSPTSYRLQLSNGSKGAQAFVADNNGLISIIYFTGSSKHTVNTEYSMDEYHVFELSLANGAQTMSIDGEQIFTSSTLSSNYCTANAILNQAGQVGANPNGTNVSVDWIAYYEVA